MAYKRKPDESKKGAPLYMTTYGDMVTLLLCFFVLLYSISNVDAEKFKKIAESFAGRPIAQDETAENSLLDGGSGLLPGYLLPDIPKENGGSDEGTNVDAVDIPKQAIDKMVSDFKTYMAQNDLAVTGIVVEEPGEYMLIRFPESMLFDSGKADIKPEAFGILDSIVDELLKYSQNEIKVEGHTDNVPMTSGRFLDNIELSSARANAVLRYFIGHGLNPQQLISEGKSEYWPIASNDTPEGRAQNRRVEVKVYANK